MAPSTPPVREGNEGHGVVAVADGSAGGTERGRAPACGRIHLLQVAKEAFHAFHELLAFALDLRMLPSEVLGELVDALLNDALELGRSLDQQPSTITPIGGQSQCSEDGAEDAGDAGDPPPLVAGLALDAYGLGGLLHTAGELTPPKSEFQNGPLFLMMGSATTPA